MIELTITPNRGTYRVYLGDTLICTTRLPFFDGARELLRLGYEPDQLMTMRHQGSAHASFEPTPIGKAAELTVIENTRVGPYVSTYRPYPQQLAA